MGATGSKVKANLGSGSKTRANVGWSHCLGQGFGCSKRRGQWQVQAEAAGPSWRLQRGWEYMDFQPHRSSSFWTSWLTMRGWGEGTVLAAPTHVTTAVSRRGGWSAHPREEEVAITANKARGGPTAEYTASVSVDRWGHLHPKRSHFFG